jgi:hypothetical protein
MVRMNPEVLALIDDLERQLAELRRIRDRLRMTERVYPGQATYWIGIARRMYELLVVRLTDDLDRADSALQAAIGETATSLGTLRRG